MSDGPSTYDANETRFTEWLRERSQPAWTKATTHRFTRELGDGTLDNDVFARYLVQDYAFVETLVSLVGYGVGDAPTMEAKARLSEFLAVVTDDEDEYFRRSFEALDVAASERSDRDRLPVTAAFEDLLLRAARQGGYAETLAVLVPVEWIYLEWATAAASGERPDRFYLDEWIDLHATPAFEETVAWLRGQLDEVGEDLSARRRARVDRLFSRAVDLEVAFFDAAYEG